MTPSRLVGRRVGMRHALNRSNRLPVSPHGRFAHVCGPSAPPLLRTALLGALFACASATPALAFNLIGGAWPSGTISVRVQLDNAAPANPSFPLTDGSTSWGAVALAAANDWNTALGRTKFSLETTGTGTTHRLSDRVNQIFFSSTIYGRAFDSSTLGVTLVDYYDSDSDLSMGTSRISEADLIVNTGRLWNSYRGGVRSSPTDLRRVLLHEMGHMLGLDHPDEANASDNPGVHNTVQNAIAIMESRISSIETLQPDDLSGIAYLYGTTIPRPEFTTAPASLTTTEANPIELAAQLNGAKPVADALHSFQWWFKASTATTFEKVPLYNMPILTIGSAQAGDSGQYFLRVITPDVTVDSPPATVTVNPLATAPTTRLANVSTRGLTGSGSRTMIVGFAIAGRTAKTVLLRAIGPTLAGSPFNVPGSLPDPKLTLMSASNGALATSADIWDQSPNASDIRSVTVQVGAFPLPTGSRDAVLLARLAPGNYTALTTSPSGINGVVLVEAYDADAAPDADSRLANLSTRGFVSIGTNIMIAGFTVAGPGAHTYLIRVAGDTLGSLGVTGTLDDPVLKLFRSDTLQRTNDDWDTPGAIQPALRTAFSQVGAFSFTDRQESAMIVTLPPGGYTAQASGFKDGTGNGLIEIYELAR